MRKGIKNLLGLGNSVPDSDSDSYSDSELDIEPYNPAMDPEHVRRVQMDMEALATGRPPRARSPTPMKLAHMQRVRMLRAERKEQKEQRAQEETQQAALERAAIEFTDGHNIDEMIRQINGKTLFNIPYVNLDHNDPDTRYVIGMIVRTHGVGEDSLRLLRRSPALFRILTDRMRNSRVTRFLCAAGSTAANCVRASGRYLSSLGSVASSRFRPSPQQVAAADASLVLQLRRPSAEASAVRLRQQQQLAIDEMLALQSDQPSAHASAGIHRRQTDADRLLAMQFMRPSLYPRPSASASAAGPAPEPPPPSPPPSAPVSPQVQDLECSICMAGANFVDQRGVNYGPLGTIVRHGNGAPGHPDKFHRRCLQACPDNKCPMCRAINPEWGLQRPQRQGGGGSRKTRSRSKSRTRRLRKPCNKPRKSRKSRKPRSLSYRRK